MAMLWRAALREVTVITAIHRKYMIEKDEILILNRPRRLAFKTIAARPARFARSWVRQVA